MSEQKINPRARALVLNGLKKFVAERHSDYPEEEQVDCGTIKNELTKKQSDLGKPISIETIYKIGCGPCQHGGHRFSTCLPNCRLLNEGAEQL